MDLFVLFLIPAYLCIGSLFWILGLLSKKATISSRRRHMLSENTIITEYVPPPRLRPAEIAYLYDQSIGTHEYLSTIFDLEARGYLELQEGNKPSLIFASETTKKPNDLLNYETDVYYAALSKQTDMRTYGTWSERLWGNQFEYLLEAELQGKGLLEPVTVQTRSFSALNITLIAGALLWAFFAQSFGAGIESFEELDRFLQYVIITLLLIVSLAITLPFVNFGYKVYKRASRLANMTESLEELWPALEGYRQYVYAVELDRIQFANKDEEQFARHEALPYAIAFNLDTKWQDRFK